MPRSRSHSRSRSRKVTPDIESGLPAAEPPADEPPACFICFDTGPATIVDGRPRDMPRTGLCQCTTLAVHLKCLESFVNTSEDVGTSFQTRLCCRVCKAPYRVTHHIRHSPATVALSAAAADHRTCSERALVLCIRDPHRAHRVASWIRGSFLVLSVLAVVLLILSAYFSWGGDAIGFGTWGILLPLALVCVPLSACGPGPRQLERWWRERRARAAAAASAGGTIPVVGPAPETARIELRELPFARFGSPRRSRTDAPARPHRHRRPRSRTPSGSRWDRELRRQAAARGTALPPTATAAPPPAPAAAAASAHGSPLSGRSSVGPAPATAVLED